MRHLLFLIFTFCITFSSAQNDVLIQKLKNSKELLSLGLLTQVEYDSIAKEIKSKILRSDGSNELDGFYYQGKRIVPEVFANHKIDMLGRALATMWMIATTDAEGEMIMGCLLHPTQEATHQTHHTLLPLIIYK